jgi:hypothetical protein
MDSNKPDFGFPPDLAPSGAAAYRAEVTLEQRHFLLLSHLIVRGFHKWWVGALRWAVSLWGAAMLVFMTLALARRFSPLLAVDLVLAAVMLLAAVFYHPLTARASFRRYPREALRTVYAFGPEDFAQVTALGTDRHGYEELHALFHWKGCYFLFLDQRRCFVVPESGITWGDPETFPLFLQSKTHRPVEEFEAKADPSIE